MGLICALNIKEEKEKVACRRANDCVGATVFAGHDEKVRASLQSWFFDKISETSSCFSGHTYSKQNSTNS
jgi:hypothetical protein